MLQDGFLFKKSELCTPKSSMWGKLIKEKHSGGMSVHFGHDKTFEQLKRFNFGQR